MRTLAPKVRRGERGVTAVQMAVIFVPVLAGMMGFAVDLGILYSVKAELRNAAQSMAIAAAQQLNGTDAAAQAATDAGLRTVETATGFGNKYYFHGFPVGGSSGTGTSTVNDPGFFSVLADAIANGGGEVGGPTARHVRVSLTGQTQLLFWSLLPIVNDRNINIAASAVAGMSAPLCQACGIESFALGAVDINDIEHFGFIPGSKYSLFYQCTGASPPVLSGAAIALPYTLINRFDPDAATFATDATQAYRQGAGGLPASTNNALACIRYNAQETVWPTVAVNACNTTVGLPQAITGEICGLYSRFDSMLPSVCTGIPEIDSLSTAYAPDTDNMDHDAYTDYTGSGRRLITIPIVDNIAAASMTVQGFRQFLVMPDPGGIATNPADTFGRFIALYVGSVAPVKQGRFDGCQFPSLQHPTLGERGALAPARARVDGTLSASW